MQLSDAELRRMGALDEIREAALEQDERKCKRKIGPYDCCSVVQGDCLELMKAIPDGAVDAVWFDPPYNVGMNYGETCNDSMPDERYRELSADWVKESLRVSREGVAVYAPHKYMLHYWTALGERARQIVLSYSPEGAIRFGLVNQFSAVLTTAKAKRYEKNVWHNCQMPGLGWFFREDTFGHPGYTSFEITARYLSSFTDEGYTVMDIFGGTGTTLVAAKKLGRHFLGFEISAEYCQIARRRLAEIDAQPSLFEPKPEQLKLGGE